MAVLLEIGMFAKSAALSEGLPMPGGECSSEICCGQQMKGVSKDTPAARYELMMLDRFGLP